MKNGIRFAIHRLEKVTRKNHDGRDYLVAPVVAVQEQILNGEFLPSDEIGAFVDAWNGIPLMLDHPMLKNQPISANDPDLIASMGLGRFYNAEFKDDKLLGEAWFDIAKIERMGGPALEAMQLVEAGEPTEVSTAYFRDYEKLAGAFNDESYSVVQRNLRPDHLAILLGDEGACSWIDGCGIPRANRKYKEVEVDISEVLNDPTFKERIITLMDDWGKKFRKESGMDKKKEDLIGKIVAHEKNPITNEEVLGVMEFDSLEELFTFLEGLDDEPSEDPKVNEIVAKIVAHEKSPIKDEKILKVMSLEKLEEMFSNLEEDPGESDEFDPKASFDELKKLIEGVVGKVDTLTTNQQKTIDEQKDEIIEVLVANDGIAFTAEELKAMPLETVEKLAQSIVPGDYSGRPMIYQRASSEEAIPDPPPVVMAEPVSKNGK